MENLTQYSFTCMHIMYLYTKDFDKNKLIKDLRKVEKHAKYELDKEGDLWFKFSEDDTLATTISDVDKDLSDNLSRYFMEKLMREAAEKGSLQVFYS